MNKPSKRQYMHNSGTECACHTRGIAIMQILKSKQHKKPKSGILFFNKNEKANNLGPTAAADNRNTCNISENG
jgi:hypothetical protein